jgi:serine phosphatase RsbU (regulator of sigma subunit)
VRAHETIPFADSEILLVMSPQRDLGGTLLARLAGITAVAGGLLSVGIALVVHNLVRRRREAERLSQENRALFDRERVIGQTLQRGLLPLGLPQMSSVIFAARYEPGVEGMDIGGDWYDVIELSDDTVLFVVGDVSGRGIRAAATMAAMRFSTRAYANQGLSPSAILGLLGDLLDVSSDGHFATMLCARINLENHEIEIANAGHPSPVLIENGRARLIDTKPGVPVGVRPAGEYLTTMIRAAPGSTLLAFTDGLYERRDEPVDAGLERVRLAVTDRPLTLEELLDDLLAKTGSGMDDDTALLGMQWTT